MRDARHIGASSAVPIIVHNPVIGGGLHGGEKCPVTSKVGVVLEKDLAIVEESTCGHVEIQLSTHPKRKSMLDRGLQVIKISCKC